MVIFKTWNTSFIVRFGCAIFLGAGMAACGGGSSSSDHSASGGAAKPPSTQLGSGYLNREEPGVFLIAGGTGGPGAIDGTGSNARFNQPTGIAFGIQGNIAVADSQNHVIRMIDKNGKVSTYAGIVGQAGSEDGGAGHARFSSLSALASDSNGNIYAADRHAIRKISPDGVVSTLAGEQPSGGFADGRFNDARFSQPLGVAADRFGNVYVADSGNHVIRRIAPDGFVQTVAGSPGNAGLTDGSGMQARFNHPAGIAVDSSGNLYVADRDNRVLRRIAPDGMVTTIQDNASIAGQDSIGSAPMQFNAPYGIAVDALGALYVSDAARIPQPDSCAGNGIIRKVLPSGQLTTLAGTSKACGGVDGMGTNARFNLPLGISISPTGEIFVADTFNHAIRKITVAGLVSTFAGKAPSYGHADGSGEQAQFGTLGGIASDRDGTLYVTDVSLLSGQATSLLRSVSPGGNVRSVAGKEGAGYRNGSAAEARFNNPAGVATDASGNIYIADKDNAVIRKIAADGMVSTFAGAAGERGSSDGPAGTARFHYPGAIAADRSGNLYVADVGTDQNGTQSAAIRKIATDGSVSTLAGRVGESGASDGPLLAARFAHPSAIAVAHDNTIYLSDSAAHTIRRISPDGMVTTIAGRAYESGSQDGSGAAARFHQPSGLAIDGEGRLLIADTRNQTIRMLDKEGKVSTIAGVDARQGTILGQLPAGLSEPSGIVYLAPKLFAVTNGASILGLRMR